METTNGNKYGSNGKGYRYIFDTFEVDPGNRILLRSGEAVPLTAKVFDVLLVFVQDAGRLLEKDGLLEKVWHGSFVEEGNLARNVSTLRKALGDEARPHKIIETVPGRGYRFIADVKEISSDERDGNERSGLHHRDKSIGSPFSPWSGKFWLFTIALAVLIGLVFMAFQMGFSPIKKMESLVFDRIHQTKLTQDGNVYAPVISRDGQYLAYADLEGADRGLCIRQVSTGAVLRLLPRSRANVWGIAISPDNSFVYYISEDENVDFGSLFRIPLLGGQPRKIVDRVDGGTTISPDARHIAFTRIDRQAGNTSIVAANNDGSDEKTITSLDLDSLYYSLEWSPDGQGFVYSVKRNESGRDIWYIVEISASGGDERRIGPPSDSKIVSTRWLPDKSGLIVNAVDDATRQPQIYFLSYPDGVRRRVTNDLNNYYGITLTADGRSIVSAQSSSNRQIWTLTEKGGSRPLQITSGAEKHYEGVSWLGNEYLIFDEDENSSFDNYNIWRMSPNGRNRQQLTFGNGDNFQPAVSPDGSSIAFVSRRSGKYELWQMNSDGSDVHQLTVLTADVSNPFYSADGRSIYFLASASGKYQLWQWSIEDRASNLVLNEDTNLWTVSPDGRSIAFTVFDPASGKPRTRIRRLDAGVAETTLNITPEIWMLWAVDGRSIYFNTNSDEVRNVWRLDLNRSAPKKVSDFTAERVFKCAWSRDGSRSACIRLTATYDAVLIQFE